MFVTLEQVKEAIKKAYGWDDSPCLHIKFESEGQVVNSGRVDTIEFPIINGGRFVLDVNDKEEAYGMEFIP